MTDWSRFPAISITPQTRIWRVHRAAHHPAFFNSSDDWRFGPPPISAHRFGTCYVGHRYPISAYIEKYGRSGAISDEQQKQDRLSELAVPEPLDVADLTQRSVLGQFGIDASYSTGSDYTKSQQLAADLSSAGFAGIRYRIRNDPEMQLEAIALFGEPGEQPGRFKQPTTQTIPDWLVGQGRQFGINTVPSEPLP